MDDKDKRLRELGRSFRIAQEYRMLQMLACEMSEETMWDEPQYKEPADAPGNQRCRCGHSRRDHANKSDRARSPQMCLFAGCPCDKFTARVEDSQSRA